MANRISEKEARRIERDRQIIDRFCDLENLYIERKLVEQKIDDARIEAGINLFILIADCKSEHEFDYELERLRITRFEADYFMICAYQQLHVRHPKTYFAWTEKFFDWQKIYRADPKPRFTEDVK